MSARQILLDEHVGRVFERLLRERGYDVVQAKDQFGEQTTDADLVESCAESEAVLITNNARDFEPLHHTAHHAGILLYHDQSLPDTDPEGLARTVDEVFNQSGTGGSTSDTRPTTLYTPAILTAASAVVGGLHNVRQPIERTVTRWDSIIDVFSYASM